MIENENESNSEWLDNYEKHLLENGPLPNYHETTLEQRKKDHQELLKAISQKGESKNE